MAFNFIKQADGKGIPFNYTRGNPIPLDSWSLFMTEADARTYATSNPVSYPGQVISVIDGTTPKVFVISNHDVQSQRKLIPLGEGSSSSQQATNTCGENCCVWFNNPEKKDAEFSDSDTWLFTDGEEHDLPEGTEANATEVTLTIDGKSVYGYRAYVPAHTEDDSGNWIEGRWSNWELIGKDGSTISIKTQKYESNVWTLNDGVDNYISEASENNALVVVVKVTKEGDEETFLAHRNWIED